MVKSIETLPNLSGFCWRLWTSCLSEAKKRPVKLVCPDLSWAYNIRDEILILDPALNVEILAPLETDLTRNRGPSPQRRAQRLKALTALAHEIPGLVLIPAESFVFRTPSKDFFLNQTLKLQAHAPLSRNSLSESLARLGYYPVEIVEQPFQFAVRGSIVDLFSPLFEYPIRLELFEDLIQSIRTFHPESQRRISDLSEAWVPPAFEFVFPASENDLASLKTQLRGFLDSWDWLKAERDALLTQVDQKSLFPTLPFWSQFFHGSPAAEFSELNWMGPIDFIVESEACLRSLVLSSSEFFSHLIRAREEGEWVPDPDGLFVKESKTLFGNLIERSSFLGFQIGNTQLSSDLAPSAKIRSTEALATRIFSRMPEPSAENKHPLPVEGSIAELQEFTSSDFKIIFCASNNAQLDRVNFLVKPYHWHFDFSSSWDHALESKSPLVGVVGPLESGLIDEEKKILVLNEEILLGTKKKRVPAGRGSQSSSTLSKNVFGSDLLLVELKPGDLVVHKEHGVGKYLGLKVMKLSGVPVELFEIEYKDQHKLFVPVTRLGLIQKHSTANEAATLDKLGGQSWEEKKAKVRKDLQSIAGELLHLYSLRQLSKASPVLPSENDLQSFAASFPFTETPDQLKAIHDVLNDLKGPRPMDRLVCGDVGYGKTEVALRAAHAAASCGFQVAILVPTTLLAIQHEAQFKKRLSPFGISVAGLSRFKSPKEVKETHEKLKTGSCSVVIGTHKILSQSVGFKNLGLLIVDEEQRFGVVHKEKIKRLRSDVHVLSMTATPIPRTLNMSLSGIRDLSIITTPPQDRMSVRTFIQKKKGSLISEALLHELRRGGQVFYVHNRVMDIEKELAFVRENSPPGTTLDVVHGQMDPAQLEERMLRFYEGKTQVLVTTAIIESGLDVPRANTLIVDRADAFGLAQLYQIRGRVGRSTLRGYAYFLLPEKGVISQDAEERLRVLEAYQELGSGFHIASHDLEIRGSGDLLGRSQSGSISALGFDAYIELLNEAVAEIKGESLAQAIDPEINIGIDTVIPDFYIPEIGLRLLFYRRLASASDESEIDVLAEEIEDRFGTPTPGTQGLFSAMKIKCLLRRLAVRSLSAGPSGYSVAFDPSTPVLPAKMVSAVQKYPLHFQFSPDGRLLIKKIHAESDPQKIVRGIETALTEIESWCRR